MYQVYGEKLMRKVKNMFDLTGKTIIVTGGAGHLGSGIGEALSAFGAELYLLGHDAEKVRRESSRLREKYEGGTCESIAFDLRDKYSVHGAVNAVMQRAQKIDVLINNAAYGCTRPLHEFEEGEWLEGIDGTINGVFRMTREVLPIMLEQGHGNIINIASMYGMVAPNMEIYGDSGQNNPANYGAGKAAIIQFTKYIACVYAEKGIRANAVSPGSFPDPMVQKDVRFIHALESKTPMHRIGTPEDLQGIMVYLASDASRYTNGQNIAVDGGWTSW